MRHIIICLILISLSLSFISCKDSSKKPSVVQKKTDQILLKEPKDEVIKIKTTPIDNITGTFTQDGKTYLMFSKGKTLQTGWQKNMTVTLPSGGKANILMTKIIGEGSWVGEYKNKKYQLIGGNTVEQIGFLEYRTAVLEDGGKRTILMEKNMAGDQGWTCQIDNKLYKEGTDSLLVQIGWKEYRIVSVKDNNRLKIMLMTKKMESIKWIGKHGGRTYCGE